MIPRAKLEPPAPFDLAAVDAPGKGCIEYPGWLGTQRDYNPNLHADATWSRVSELLDDERDALARADANSRDFQGFDEMAFDVFETEGSVSGLLELGVTSLVYALNAVGCVSASSCRGHPNTGSECPWVLFAGSPERVAVIAALAARAGVVIDNVDGGGVALFGPSVIEMVALAEAIVEKACVFDRIPSKLGPSGSRPRQAGTRAFNQSQT